MDDAVRRWRQKGTIYFWFEPDKRQGNGWHLAADEHGCQDLERIIALAQAAEYSSRFKIIPTPTAGRRNASKLILSYNVEWPSHHWSLQSSEGAVTIELGDDRLNELKSAVPDLRKRNGGDYTIGAEEDDPVWIWWRPTGE